MLFRSYPRDLRPDRGVRKQMAAQRVGNVWMSQRQVENLWAVPAPHLQNDGKANITSTSPGEINPVRVDKWARMRPVWR